MADTVFDKETLLDLIVNGVPLFILLFFLGVFVALPYFGFGGLATLEQFLIVGLSFVGLAILTYIAAKKIAGTEKEGTNYLPGQANVPGAKPIEEREEEREGEYYGEAENEESS